MTVDELIEEVTEELAVTVEGLAIAGVVWTVTRYKR